MIDKRKNVCYVIEMYYIRADKECSVKFLSQHGISSRRFKAFADHYFKHVFPVAERKRRDFDGGIGSQLTISWDMWKEEKWKKYALEGITEKEKCY